MKKRTAIIIVSVIILFTASISYASGMATIDVYRNYVTLMVNGQYVSVDNFLYNGTTYIPLRAVSELLGATVEWNDYSKTAIVQMPTNNYIVNDINDDEYYSLPLHLYSNDRKTYLGKLVTDDMDPDGLWYRLIGDYSSKVSSLSIWNTVGSYGSSISSESAFCKFATSPPIIVDNEGRFVMYLTVNPNITPGCDPNNLKQLLINIGQ